MLRWIVVLAAVLAAESAVRAGENWTGYEGGNLHHNASAVDIDPAGLAVKWEARFDHPMDCRTTNPGFFGSRNLALLDGYLALVAANYSDDFEGGMPYAFVSILDAATGKVVNCISTTQVTGPRRAQIAYPTGNFMEAFDTGIGITMTAWDAQTKTLFLRNGGDNPSNTAYLPLANLAAYTGKGFQKGAGAYDQMLAEHPKLKDADGNVRQDKELPQDATRWLQGDHWDYGNPKGKFNNQPNSTAFFEIDPTSPTITAAIDPAHHQAWGLFIDNRFNGQYGKPYTAPLDLKRPNFGKYGGVRAANGMLYLMGPCDDTAGDGFITSLYENSKPDQGLCLRAYKVDWSDKQDNDGATGAATLDTATLTLAWAREFHSPHKPSSPEDAESYLELDAFHRNKAWLIDGDSLWAAWKKDRAGHVELICADAEGSKTYDLGIGGGQRGQDLWPHISLAEAGGNKYIIYYAGNGLYRPFADGKWAVGPRLPLGPAALAVFNATTGKLAWTYTLNTANGTGPHATLTPNEAEGYFDRSAMVVAGRYAYIAWVATDTMPGTQGFKPTARPRRGAATSQAAPAEAAPAATLPTTMPAPLPAVTAAPAGNCVLHVLAFDITAPAAKPVEFTRDLGISKADNGQSCVFNMIAADGTLYVLVTESGTLSSADHTWKAQRVIAIAGKK